MYCSSVTVAFTIAQVPLVPLIPGASILANVFLMMKLSALTWVRFSVWIAIGKNAPSRYRHMSLKQHAFCFIVVLS